MCAPPSLPLLALPQMPMRRSHAKSRLGCHQCKVRRVKCDEQLPSCTRCVKRGEKCSFLTASTEQDSPTSHSNSNGTPHDCSAEQHSRHSFDLELMHQWSTVTWKTMQNSKLNSEQVLAINLPRNALKYEYLLDGIFSFTALHLAYQHQADPHTMDYYATAGMSFRERGMQRAAPAIQEHYKNGREPESSEVVALFWFSALAGLTSMALTVLTRREPANFASPEVVTGRPFINMQVEMAQLWRGTRTIGDVALSMNTHADIYTRDPGEPKRELVDAETDAALSQLELLVSRPATTPSGDVVDDDHTPLYCQSVALTRRGFAAHAATGTLDDALGWSPVLGIEFSLLLKEGVPRALLCTMCYGTLLDAASIRWWASDSGRMLVYECSKELAGCPEEWYPLIQWARARVGLPESNTPSSAPSDPPSVG